MQCFVLYLCLSSLLTSCSSNKTSETIHDKRTTQTNSTQAHAIQEALIPETTITETAKKESINQETNALKHTNQERIDHKPQEHDKIRCSKRLAKNFSKISKSSYSPPKDSKPSPKQNNKSHTQKEFNTNTHALNKEDLRPTTKAKGSKTQNLASDNHNGEETIFEQELPCAIQSEQPPFGLVMISKARATIGDRYLNLSRSMDSIFSGDDSADFSKNDSHLRLSTQATYFEDGSIDQDFSLKAKLDLPKTTNRLQLFFDSRFEEDESLEERNTTASSGERVNRRESVAGLEYGRNKKDAKWRYGIRLGARTGLPLRLFTRLRVERRWILSDVFSTRFQQDIWYLKGTGLGETTYFDLKTIINERVYLLNETEIQYEDDRFPISYYHAFNIFHRISDKSRIRYRLAAVGTDDENAFIDRYFVNVSFTYRLYKEWLFVSFIPEVVFRAEFQTDNELNENPMPVPNNFKPWDPEASFTLKFDIFSN